MSPTLFMHCYLAFFSATTLAARQPSHIQPDRYSSSRVLGPIPTLTTDKRSGRSSLEEKAHHTLSIPVPYSS